MFLKRDRKVSSRIRIGRKFGLSEPIKKTQNTHSIKISQLKQTVIVGACFNIKWMISCNKVIIKK